MNTFKVLEFIHKGDKDRFGVPVVEQKEFLQKLGTPKDDVDRSYKQYQCQKLFMKKWKSCTLNVIAFFATPILLIILLLKGLFVKAQSHIEAIASLPLKMQFFSEDLLREYNVNDNVWGKGRSLQLADLSFVLKVLARGYMSPYFVCNSIILVSTYSDMINRYSPQALLAHCEYSFTCSLLTAYCKNKNVLHINTMHGDKFYYIRDSFVHFDQFYVWDEHYKNLLISMGAETSQFKVFVPESLKFDCKKFVNSGCYADYKYYLQIYTEEELKGVLTSLRRIEEAGASYKLRPHPRYSDMKILHKYVDETHIEMPQDISIQESVSNCHYAVGSFSTVLTQAFYSRKKVVLDDVTYNEQYMKLVDIQYILTNKETIKLSDVVNNSIRY